MRPYGWERKALKVIGKFEAGDAWLGKPGSRLEATTGEWPVCYHGTNEDNANSIAQQGFLLSKGKRFANGRGIYSSPDIEVAAVYDSSFTVPDAGCYKLIFQNRVRPDCLEKFDVAGDKVRLDKPTVQYWVSPEPENIRPYGICIKKVD